DGTNPNDIILLNFGIEATDCNGDKSQTTLTVKVKDDASLANPDSKDVAEGGTVSGNVTTNDTVCQDSPGTVTKAVFNGTPYDVPSSGTVTVPGAYGTLTIDKTGAFSYTAKSNNPDGIDQFKYTLKDADGDTAISTLDICVTSNDDCPVIIKPSDEI